MPSPTPEQAPPWPTKDRRPTPTETATIRRKVHEIADRMREESIKGRPNAWNDLRH